MRHVRMLGLCLTASIVMSAMVAAGAAASEPTKSKKIFQNCPVHFKTENGKQTFACIYGKTAATKAGTIRSVVLRYRWQSPLYFSMAWYWKRAKNNMFHRSTESKPLRRHQRRSPGNQSHISPLRNRKN